MTQHLSTISGHPISRFAYGTMQWGGTADETAARAMFDDCRAAGLNHFDTAYVYTGGQSETILGRFIGAARDHFYIATKAAYDGGSTRDNILSSVDTSRNRLKIDVIDLLYMHRWDGDTPLEETLETLAQLQSQGTIRHIGVSNYAAWQVMKAQAVAAEFGTRIDVIQPMYNLVKRQAEVELFPMCADQGIQPIPYSPLGGGLLTGKYGSADASGRLKDDDRYAVRYGVEAMHETASLLTAAAEELGVAPATLAVAWAARHPVGPMPIISARSSEQLAPSLAALSFDMDDALYARLTAFSQTPPPATDRLEEA